MSTPINGTITLNGNNQGTYNTILTPNNTYTLPNNGNLGGSWTNATWGADTSTYDFDTKVLDIEKLSKMDVSKKDMLFNLFLNFMNNENYQSKKLMYNTLESYGLIIDQKTLKRKVKISNLTHDEKGN